MFPSAFMTSPDDVPSGLVFATGDPRRKKRRLGLTAVVVLATLALTAPGYSWVSSSEPYILGLPLSLAWVIGWLVIVFVVLAAFYWKEEIDTTP